MGSLATSDLPTLRWGIIGAGLISSWFVKDLTLNRKDAKANHVIQAIGCSSLSKGQVFVEKHLANATPKPKVYGSYDELCSDSEVDVVYIGTPHAFHKKNCLDAINAGKHVLCEKAFTITAKEAREIADAAKRKNVFVMEAMWLRFRPLVAELRKKLYDERAIGDVRRVICDFSVFMPFEELGSESRLKNAALGAGSLLDIGVYSLTWGIIALESPEMKVEDRRPQVAATQRLVGGIDVASSILLYYPSTGRQAILSSSIEAKTDRGFARIEGTKGHIVVEGLAASHPTSFVVYHKNSEPEPGEPIAFDKAGEKLTFEQEGMGFFYEADAVAQDIAAGRTENAIMPLDESIRVMGIMDEVRRQGGARFLQDDE